MSTFKNYLYLSMIVILFFLFFKSSFAQPSSNDSGSSKVNYKSTQISTEKLYTDLMNLLKLYNCLDSCDNCKKVPCNALCDDLCEKYRDLSIITVHDTNKNHNDPVAETLASIATDAYNLKLEFTKFKILSGKVSKNFRIREAELENLISKLELKLLNLSINSNFDKTLMPENIK